MTEKLRIAIRAFPSFERSIQRQFDHFKAANSFDLDLELVSLDLNPLTKTLFDDGGLTDGTWDIAFIVTDWLADAVETGALLDLAPMMARDPIPGYPEEWSTALTRFQQCGSAVYGIPYHDGPECFIYRKDWFEDSSERERYLEQHGRPLEIPTTWSAFEEIARFFNRPEEGRFGTIFAAYPDGHNTVYDFCLQLWSRGGELADANGSVTLDTPQAIAALDCYRRMVKDRTMTPPGLESVDSVQSGARFAAGEIAMMVNWFGFAAVCEQPDCPVKGKVGVAPLPAGDNGTSTSLNVYWLLGIGSGSRHKEAAYAFIRHCATPEMDKITTMEGGIGCRLSTWHDPEVNAAIPFYNQLAELHLHTRELPRSRDLPRLIHVIDRAVQHALSSEESTGEILRRAQREANSITL